MKWALFAVLAASLLAFGLSSRAQRRAVTVDRAQRDEPIAVTPPTKTRLPWLQWAVNQTKRFRVAMEPDPPPAPRPDETKLQRLEREIREYRYWAKSAHERDPHHFAPVPTSAEILSERRRSIRLHVHRPAGVQPGWKVSIEGEGEFCWYEISNVAGVVVLARLQGRYTQKDALGPRSIEIHPPAYLAPQPAVPFRESEGEREARLEAELKALKEISAYRSRSMRFGGPMKHEFKARVLRVAQEGEKLRVWLDAGAMDGMVKGDCLQVWGKRRPFSFLDVDAIEAEECSGLCRASSNTSWWPREGDIGTLHNW